MATLLVMLDLHMNTALLSVLAASGVRRGLIDGHLLLQCGCELQLKAGI
jgi:hypothetical protein